MRYDVTYQVAGQEHTDQVDAPDAATAAAQVQMAHGRSAELFELIYVHLLDAPESAENAGKDLAEDSGG